MALLSLMDTVTDAVDENKFVIGLFIDLSKAFDTLNHEILLKKLEFYGVRGIVLQLFSDCLRNRTQCVSYNGSTSDFLSITCGVPQGSVLGPLLFLLYINDIYKTSSLLKFILFADDTTIIFSARSLSELTDTVNSELKVVADWFRVNKLSLNIAKTNYIIFRNSVANSSSFPVYFESIQVMQVEEAKFLGVVIDSKLSWKTHIRNIEKKLSCAVGIMGKIRYKLNRKTCLLLYDTLVLTHLNYCNIVWATTYKSSLLKVASLQKRALKICCRNDKEVGCSVYKCCNKLSIFDLNKMCVAKFVFSALKNTLPTYFTNYFKNVSAVHQYSTRQTNKLFLHYAKSNMRKFFVSIAGPAVWNTIPDKIKAVNSVYAFHKMYKNYLFENY
jgi:hypothetical protein